MQRSSQKILQLLKTRTVLRPVDLDELGIPRITLQRLYLRGLVEKLARGVYKLPGIPVSEHHSLAEAAKMVPKGIICLFSALRFHDLTTQTPHEIWMAIDRKTRLPVHKELPIRFVRFSGPALIEGVESHIIDGIPVAIYQPGKTVADCFKYRNKIGLDVALEALKDCLRNRRCEADTLWKFAKICRMSNVMRPYLEAMNA
ncbi:type IV toxin-antitoxin system AbiEi family antitoxin domain-containing protein [Desulfobulbus alkaliphilus]|uniref:type IV toxin-antitoxin system AbiEi family antitoxin domain-containing protein n=1 Tax=Desulfobulbus alkaliphilus TaxID=869814 RepID=UPI0019664874|nr:type IV toxin-antitoxin system AbiEi family antitoxin domain-containing protein [Desulfobulbus alkaliphilus]MBM9538742.1 transcriptional regulator [Desulfobulbus alkaliphilus]